MAAGTAAILARPSAAYAQPGAPASAPALPPRGEFVVRDGHVLTMDPDLGDFPAADVHVRDGTIVAVGPNLSAAGAEILDGRGMIVAPGFVDTHWHLWTTSLRGIIRADDPKEGYFPLTIRLGPQFTPHNSYCAVRFGAAEGLLSGITTVHDWSHNTRSPEHADAEI